ncbi:hypothetical protein JJB11_03825 [Ramlibacter ginsenosidimutans]|uniref:Uncharacterized protein n=1 Tax=Ramlibacter ginsenosidimutans TaxID=502333 RepID=A0A934WL53_9BURK|nr:hypothetical protein [Ramlibacter ginsenosidimutans]MBK6005211.1 hypothetical protein [Ramlibacter ginsenosidimutans]
MSRQPLFPMTRDLECSIKGAASAGERLVDQYASAEPFPHIVMDDFPDPSLLERGAAKLHA